MVSKRSFPRVPDSIRRPSIPRISALLVENVYLFPLCQLLCCLICRFVPSVMLCSMCPLRLIKSSMLFLVSSLSVNFFVISVREFVLCSFRKFLRFFSRDVLFHAFLYCGKCPASLWIPYVAFCLLSFHEFLCHVVYCFIPQAPVCCIVYVLLCVIYCVADMLFHCSLL